MISFVAFAGLRPETLGNMNGSDGLRIGNLPEMKIQNGQVVLTKIPK